MKQEELYDAPNNSGLSQQELPLEDFGDCELKSQPYIIMQFDSLDGVETFYKEFLKIVYVRVKKHPKVIM